MREEIIMDKLNKETFLLFPSYSYLRKLATLFVEGKAKLAKEAYSKVCYTEQNVDS